MGDRLLEYDLHAVDDESVHRRRKLIVKGLNEIGLPTFEPKGAFYAFPKISVTGLDDETFSMKLLNEEHVACVPGNSFGLGGYQNTALEGLLPVVLDAGGTPYSFERYRMQVMRGTFECYEQATNEALMRMSTYEWPHAFARFSADAETVLTKYGSNHIHAVPGDYVEELRVYSSLMDVDYEDLGATS